MKQALKFDFYKAPNISVTKLGIVIISISSLLAVLSSHGLITSQCFRERVHNFGRC